MTKNLTKTEAEGVYNEIVRGYDLAENVVEVVSDESYTESPVLIGNVASFVQQMQESTDQLGDTFLDFYEGDQLADPKMKKDFDSAVRVFFHQARQLLNYIEKQC